MATTNTSNVIEDTKSKIHPDLHEIIQDIIQTTTVEYSRRNRRGDEIFDESITNLIGDIGLHVTTRLDNQIRNQKLNSLLDVVIGTIELSVYLRCPFVIVVEKISSDNADERTLRNVIGRLYSLWDNVEAITSKNAEPAGIIYIFGELLKAVINYAMDWSQMDQAKLAAALRSRFAVI